MDRLLARLERRFGGFAIPNLPAVVVVGMVLVFMLAMMRPETLLLVTFDWPAIRAGQVWRLVTFVFVPKSFSMLMFSISVMFTWWVLSTLNGLWGAFRFNAYLFGGMASVIVAAIATGSPANNLWLLESFVLAMATLFPDQQIRLMLIIPVPFKVVGFLAAGFGIYSCVIGDWGTRAMVLAGFVNYLVFFADYWVDFARGRSRMARQSMRRESMRAEVDKARPSDVGVRVCAMCGAKEEDGADIRVCTCEKCAPRRNLCLEHARSH